MTLIIRKLIGNFFCFVVPGVTLLLMILFTVSPLAFTQAGIWVDSMARTSATIQSCKLVRDGVRAQHAIRCDAQYVYDGQSYQKTVDVWSSQSPFATPASLQRELQRYGGKQDGDGSRNQSPSVGSNQAVVVLQEVAFSPRYPARATAVDNRLLAMPGLGAFVIVLVCAVFGFALYRAPRSLVHRRADYVLDRETDELVPINDNRARRVSRQSMVWSVALVLGMLACVYGLSSRLPQSLSMLAFKQLEAQPAQLLGCEHRRYGGRKGYEKIDCQFQYTFDGKVFTGQAESLDFRSFPTGARLDARVAEVEGTATIAHVDPVHPSYAMALIDTRWFVPHTFGLFELMLLVLLVGVLPIALGVVLFGRSRRGAE